MLKTRKKHGRNRRSLRAVIATLALIISLSGVPAWAQDNATEKGKDSERIMVLDNMSVTAKKEEQGKITITRDKLDRLPTSTGSITETLRTQPNVQFDDAFGSSLTGGEITPPQISISGGKPYENNFTIDGISNNNRIDPSGFDYMNDAEFLTGAPQSMFLDTELIDEVEAFTSNVSAKYGSFTGGVVNAKTRRPAHEFGGKFKLRHTRDTWANQRPVDRDEFDNSDSPSLQPNFSRYSGSLTLDLPITDSTAALLSYGVKHSTIPLDYMYGEKDQTRVSQNLFGKLVHDIDDNTTVDLTMMYAPYSATCYNRELRDSKFTLESGGYNAGLGLEREMDLGTLNVRTVYSQTELSRDGESATNYQWSKDGTSTQWGSRRTAKEGGFGDAESLQRSIASNVDFATNAIDLGSTSHKVAFGLSHENIFGSYDQKDTQTMFLAANVNSGVIDDGSGGIRDGEQFATRKTVREATSRSASMNLLDAYIEDEISFWQVTLRPGVRVSFDDVFEKTNIAPRFKTTFDVLGDGKYTLIGGLNRYYGTPLLSYALRTKSPDQRYTRSAALNADGTPQDWGTPKSGPAHDYSLAGLDTPYSDEAMLGAAAKIFGGIATLEYVHRDGRDQLATKSALNKGDKSFFQTNDGRTEYEGYTLKFEKTVDEHYFSLGATYSEQSTNFTDFTDASNDNFFSDFGYDLDQVYYDGELISRDDLPASNFNRPWVVTFLYSGKFFDKLTFTNTTRYVSSFDTIIKDSRPYIDEDKNKYYAYSDTSIDDCVTFDWQFDYEAWRHKNQLLTLNLTVNNVFDATSIVDKEGNRMNGRQFWAGLTYEF